MTTVPNLNQGSNDVEREPGVELVVENTRLVIDFEEVAQRCAENPAAMLWWADVLSRAERELVTVETACRVARAEATQTLLTKNPKLAEWRYRAIFETGEAYAEGRKVLADAIRNVTLLRALVGVVRARD